MAATSVQWSSKFAFIMAAVGSSVGLGNLWRFSAEAGTNGGGAFILVYLAAIFLVGIPVLMSEYLMGRAGQASSSVLSIDDLADRSGVSRLWSSSAWIGMTASLLIVSFYCVVAAWVMAYIPKFLFGAFDGQSADQIAAQFDELAGSPKAVFPWFLIFGGITIWLVSRGVNRGIEAASKILMPLFFILLLCLSVYSISISTQSGGTLQAAKFLFLPDFSKISGEVAAAALGQACFSLGIGSAIMITYGSYLPKDISIPKAALTVGLVDTCVALIAGMAIFPIVFHTGLDFKAGAGVFFQTIPTAMSSAPAGNIIGASFFFLAMFAAITSSISLLEPITAWFAEAFGKSKSFAAGIMGILMLAIGTICIFSGPFFAFIDEGLTGPIMLPLSALLVVLFTGWRLNKAILSEQISGEGETLGRLLLVAVRYIAPIFITIVLILGIYDQYFAAAS